MKTIYGRPSRDHDLMVDYYAPDDVGWQDLPDVDWGWLIEGVVKAYSGSGFRPESVKITIAKERVCSP